MRPAAGDAAQGAVLVDRAASFGPGFGPQRRRRGTLTLTADALKFRSADGQDVQEIPLSDIDGLGTGVSRLGGPLGHGVLRVLYRKNLVFGVTVANPETWVNAIGALTPSGGGAVRLDEAPRRTADLRGFRVVVGLFLLFILLMSAAVPLFLSWMQARQNSPVEVVEPETLFGP